MYFEMFGQLDNTPGEQGNLHLGRTSIGFVNASFSDDARFFFNLKWHSCTPPVCQTGQSNGNYLPGCIIPCNLEVRNCAQSYLMVTFAPTSAILSAMRWASSLETASLMALGASSTTALASFRPRPVSSRTTLMTLILLGPTSDRTASNSVCSSTTAAGAASAATATAGPEAATGAALTPHLSCKVLVSSTSSSTFSFSISAIMVSTDMFFSPSIIERVVQRPVVVRRGL